MSVTGSRGKHAHPGIDRWILRGDWCEEIRPLISRLPTLLSSPPPFYTHVHTPNDNGKRLDVCVAVVPLFSLVSSCVCFFTSHARNKSPANAQRSHISWCHLEVKLYRQLTESCDEVNGYCKMSTWTKNVHPVTIHPVTQSEVDIQLRFSSMCVFQWIRIFNISLAKGLRVHWVETWPCCFLRDGARRI